MKTLLMTLIFGSLGASLHAGMPIPKSIYKPDQLEAASAEAVKENKSLAFVMSDPNTTCGLCIAATELAFKSLKSHSVIVFVNSEDNNRWANLSPWIVTGFSEKKTGNNIPKAVISSPDMSELWGQMSYQDLRETGPYRDMKKQVDAILKGGPKPVSPPDRAIYWPLKGKKSFYIGSFVGLDDKGGLRIKMQEGKKLSTIQLNVLTEPCATLARKLAGSGTAAAPQTAVDKPHDFEPWTASNGKTLRARFVKLDGENVTLELEGGKTHTLPLERLDESSRERAKFLQSGKQT